MNIPNFISAGKQIVKRQEETKATLIDNLRRKIEKREDLELEIFCKKINSSLLQLCSEKLLLKSFKYTSTNLTEGYRPQEIEVINFGRYLAGGENTDYYGITRLGLDRTTYDKNEECYLAHLILEIKDIDLLKSILDNSKDNKDHKDTELIKHIACYGSQSEHYKSGLDFYGGLKKNGEVTHLAGLFTNSSGKDEDFIRQIGFSDGLKMLPRGYFEWTRWEPDR